MSNISSSDVVAIYGDKCKIVKAYLQVPMTS